MVTVGVLRERRRKVLEGGRTLIAIGPWVDVDLAASLTNSDMTIAGQTGAIEVMLPFAGDIVAITVRSSEARTASTATFKITKNGTALGSGAILDETNTSQHKETFKEGQQTFAADDRIGVQVTTPAAWTPTTADVAVMIYAVMAHQ